MTKKRNSVEQAERFVLITKKTEKAVNIRAAASLEAEINGKIAVADFGQRAGYAAGGWYKLADGSGYVLAELFIGEAPCNDDNANSAKDDSIASVKSGEGGEEVSQGEGATSLEESTEGATKASEEE